MHMERSKQQTQTHHTFSQMKKYKGSYFLLLPAVVFVFIFSYLPFGGIVIAFKDFSIKNGIWGSQWVGFKHFATIFSQPGMLSAIGRSLLYGSVLLFGTFPFPILLAILFNELRSIKFKRVVQTVSYMPHFISWISVIGLFYTFFATEGTFNNLMQKLFGSSYEACNILLDDRYFLPVLFVSNLWKSVGWSSVVFLAAIAGIDPTLYEAATVDGCGKLKQVWHITLPCIRTTALIVLIMSLGTLFNTNFEQVYGFQNVYTQEQTEVINTLIYRQGIENGKYDVSTAFGIAQGLVMLVMVLTANTVSKKIFSASIW